DAGDAYKGAVTDALGKIASYLGVGIDVYKGGGPTKMNPRGRAVSPRPATPIDTGGHPVGTQAAADYVAQQKIAAGKVEATARVVPVPAEKPKPWSNRGEMRRAFAAVREQLGEYTYLGEMERTGVRS